MPVHAMLQYTAREGAVEELTEHARAFAGHATEREPHALRHEVLRFEGSRTFLHLMSFEDALAAEDHRSSKHTRRFTADLAGLIEGDPQLLELEHLAGFPP